MCDLKNPKGTCCLGDVNAVVKEVLARRESVYKNLTDTPSGNYLRATVNLWNTTMLNQKEKKTIRQRLRYVEGQLKGIEKMIQEDRSVQEVFDQLKAVEQGIHTTLYDVFEDQLKMHLAEVLSARLAACPGNCNDAERLQFTKQQFAQLDLKGVIDSLSWLTGREDGNSSSVIKKRKLKNEQ
ncbi:MAG: metal-sensing transcriptional repressor [Ignavibacteriae bacterium]|nr:metal-sensing transcriptional repressor [Ignavibacteriota bacterium]